MSKAVEREDAAHDIGGDLRAGQSGSSRGNSREVRPLPVIALCTILLTIAAVVYAGRSGPATRRAAALTGRRADEPAPARDVDHYVPGSPPAVAERFLRAWMRFHFDEARDLATGDMRRRAEEQIQQINAFNADQMEAFRHERAVADAAHVDLEHVEMRDLPPAANGNPRKEVRGQGHAYGTINGAQVDSRRGQTFVLERVEGAWRVAERTWETFGR